MTARNGTQQQMPVWRWNGQEPAAQTATRRLPEPRRARMGVNGRTFGGRVGCSGRNDN